MAIDYSKYISKPAGANPAVGQQLAAQGVRGFRESRQFNRQQTEDERRALEEERLARESLDFNREQLAKQEASGEAWRQLQMTMHDRGQAAKIASEGREQEHIHAQQVQAMQVEAGMLAQSADPASQQRMNVLLGMLGGMGYDHSFEGSAAQQPQEAPAPQGHIGAEQDRWSAFNPLEQVAAQQGPAQTPDATLEPIPQAAAGNLLNIEDIPGPQASPIGAGPAEPVVPLPPPRHRTPPPPEMQAEVGPQGQVLRFTDRATGESFAMEQTPDVVQEHFANQMHTQVDELVPPSTRPSWHAAIEIAKTKPVRSSMDSGQQWAEVGKIAKQLSAQDIAYQNMEWKKRQRFGKPIGAKRVDVTAYGNMRLSAQSKQGSDISRMINNRKLPEAKEFLTGFSSMLKGIDTGNSIEVENIINGMATAAQSGVLSNQDKKAFMSGLGAAGTIENFLAHNKNFFQGEGGEVPAAHRKRLRKALVATKTSMLRTANATFRELERSYRSKNAAYAKAMAGGYSNDAVNQATIITSVAEREEIEEAMRLHFTGKTYGKRLDALFETSSHADKPPTAEEFGL